MLLKILQSLSQVFPVKSGDRAHLYDVLNSHVTLEELVLWHFLSHFRTLGFQDTALWKRLVLVFSSKFKRSERSL